MLRSQGIPAQFVLGFRGCESVGDGNYENRQSQAHTWVEAIIYRSPPKQLLPLRAGEPPPSHPVSQHWLSLDPTPGGTAESESGQSNWIENAYTRIENFFRVFVLGYDANTSRRLLDPIVNGIEDLWDDLAAGRVTASVAGVGGCALLVPIGLVMRRRLRRAATHSPVEMARNSIKQVLPVYQELLDLLADHGLTPGPGRTHEFARDAGKLLSQSQALALAALPARMADAYYRVRFGGQTLPESETKELEAAVKQLAEVLSAIHFRAPTDETT